ncbi:cold shock domain-containing protein E1 [Aplochiton taeniatus]
MSPGIRVHFTACKEKNSQIATDVKVAPGGTENVDTEIYEGVVSQNIVQPMPGVKQKPGQIHIHMGPIQTNLSFEKRDCTVTLLRGDRVLINILTDIVSEKRRATNIKPKIPATFAHSKEKREKGTILSMSDVEGVIQSESLGELPFDLIENLGDTAINPSEEVEFTVLTVKEKDRAIRISKVKAPPVKVEAEGPTKREDAKKVEDEKKEKAIVEDGKKEKENEETVNAEKWMPMGFKELKREENDDISKQKYEGTVLTALVKVPPKEKV